MQQNTHRREVMALFNFPSGGQTAAGKGSIREDRMGNINIVDNAYALENW